MISKNGLEDSSTYLNLFDDAQIGIFRSSFDGKLLYVNNAFSTILKYDSPEEIIASINDIEQQMFVKKHNRPEMLEQIKRAGKLSNHEIQYYCKDDSMITALLNIQIKHDQQGNELFLEGFINDITYIKEKENALIEREERWNFALEGSAHGVWDWDVKSNVFYRSKQYNAIRGYGNNGLKNAYEDWIDFIHPEDKDRVVKELNKHVEGKTSIYTAEYRIQQKDGSYIWVHERAKATESGSDGRAIRIVGTQRDVTKERNSQDALLYQKKSFECLFDNSPEAIAYFDQNENIIRVNPAFTKLFGYTDEEVKGRHVNNIIDPLNKIETYLTFAHFDKQNLKFKDTVRYDKSGNPINILAKGVPIVINNKMVAGYSIYTDVRFMKQAEKEIKKQKKILESLFRYSPDAIIHIDLNNTILEINQTFTDIFGYSFDEALGKTIDELITPVNHMEEALEINDMALQNKKIEIDTVRKSKEGLLIEVCIRGGPTIVDGKIIGYHGIYTDIRERKAAEAKIRFLSFYDKLTGLYNRAFFEEELKRLDMERQLPLAIIIGDVNGLKLTNDVFGHFVGDQLLIETADILTKACRKEDVICRWGGDEFAILLPRTNKESVDKICCRINDLCKEPSDLPISISISIGYAIKQSSKESVIVIIKKAEEKMYRNKLLESKSTRSHIINSLQRSLYERSHETESHGKRMKEMSIALGKGLHLDNDKLNELGLLAILHDIGKMAIPDAILEKPGKLTRAEWEKMKSHSEIGYRIAETSPELIHISKYILFHHEQWDGTGYPQGLKGKEIPLLSRIISVVDVYDVMTHDRVYKKAVSHEEAVKELQRCSGTQFDPEIIIKFVELFGRVKEKDREDRGTE